MTPISWPFLFQKSGHWPFIFGRVHNLFTFGWPNGQKKWPIGQICEKKWPVNCEQIMNKIPQKSNLD